MTETLALHRPKLDPSDQVSLHEHEQNDQRYDAHRNGSHEQVRPMRAQSEKIQFAGCVFLALAGRPSR